MITSAGTIVRYLFPNSVRGRDWRTQNDGNGSYISYWNLPDPQPTMAELEAAEADAINSAKDKEADSAVADSNDKIKRLLFEINFDQENRVRTLEGAGTITKAQYKNALKNLYKTL